MSMKHPLLPKGAACALHLTPEYEEGKQAWKNGNSINPYDFFDDYEKYYAWDIGWQKGRHEES